MKKILFLPLLFLLPLNLLGQTASTDSLQKKVIESQGLFFEGGAGFPSRWSFGGFYPIGSGVSLGIASQGTYSGYAPTDAAKPEIRTVDFVVDYGTPEWRSCFRGTGLGASMGGAYTTKGVGNIPVHLGFYVNLCVTALCTKTLSVSAYARPLVSFMGTSQNHTGLVWAYQTQTEKQFNFGVRLSFCRKQIKQIIT